MVQILLSHCCPRLVWNMGQASWDVIAEPCLALLWEISSLTGNLEFCRTGTAFVAGVGSACS